MISVRLKTIASLVDINDITLDVGCDHALLDIYLAKNIKNKKIYASDININAFNNGFSNIRKYSFCDNICIYLDNGISNMKPDVDTLIISGMGTNTILSILNNDNIKKIKKMIISTNKNVCLLRKEVTNMGFYIYDEILIKEKNKYYPIIVFKRGNREYTINELLCGPFIMKNDSSLYLEYIKTIKND